MISLKNVVLLGALAVCFSAPAFAKSQAAVEPTTQAAVLNSDIANSVFEQKAKVEQVAKLSNKEMKETEGAWWPIVYYAYSTAPVWAPMVTMGARWAMSSGGQVNLGRTFRWR